MSVDRRAIRRFPGRKKRGGRRQHASPQPPASGALLLSAAERLGLAVSSEELVNASALRSAFEYDQAQFLQVFAADRHARVRAVQATFLKMGVDHFDPIKKLVWTYLDQPPTWQFLDNAGWMDCDAATQTALNDAERNGLDSVDLQVRRYVCRFYLAEMVQENVQTGKRRSLRRASPWSSTQQLPRWQYAWTSCWVDCDLETQQILGDLVTEAEHDEKTVVHKMMRGVFYDVDLVALTQTNLGTGRVRALRFGRPIVDADH